ncbi:hypothetical protein HELRODRAFT_159283 [Helobdella robusta]|uniref:TOG domain-containing protein n=1 Tax=Helobdella robusta TaxID=6412 RepID=T1ENU1_HELRO|nr:hypothetical protein HELRODRAFT_159283 [Helobdella robusta]ESO12699.1 hypothetical protein HELRODRAFT_159283 [Helobdella robusta]
MKQIIEDVSSLYMSSSNYPTIVKTGSVKRKFHSSGQLERTVTIEENLNNVGLHSGNGSFFEDAGGTNYITRDGSKAGFYATAPPILSNSPNAGGFEIYVKMFLQSKFSADKNRVSKMFDMLERKERFDGRKIVSRDKLFEDDNRIAGNSKRFPIKANYDQRMFVNKEHCCVDSEGDRLHDSHLVSNAFTTSADENKHKSVIPWDEVAIPGVKYSDKYEDDRSQSDDVPAKQMNERFHSPPLGCAFPGRNEYPLDEHLKDDWRYNVNNNSVVASTKNNFAKRAQVHDPPIKSNFNLPNPVTNARRISVVQIEMPDSLSFLNKNAFEIYLVADKNADYAQKEMSSNANSNNRSSMKLSKNRTSMRKKKDHLTAEVGLKQEEKPILKPTLSTIQEIITILNSDDWKAEVSSLETIGSMSCTNAELIASNLHSLIHPILKEVTNLRSNVSMAAMKCLSEMFKSLQTAMEPVLDRTIIELLNRSGHTNNFMKEEALRCLNVIIENVSPIKSVSAIISYGNNHRNVTIRNASSQLIVNICFMLGPHSILVDGPKDVTNKILSTATHYLTDGSPESKLHNRTNGRKLFSNLRGHVEFDRSMRLHLPHDVITKVVEPALKGLESRNDVEHNTTMSAQTRVNKNSMKHSRYHSAGNLCNIVSNAENTAQPPAPPSQTTTSTIPSSKGKKQVKLDDSTLDAVNKIIDALDSNDFRERLNGLNDLRALVIQEGKVNAVVSHVNRIYDKLAPCLKDSNFKVTIQALQVFKDLLPYVSAHLTNLISMTIANVSSNMASNNRDVRDSANLVLDGCIQFMDPAILMPSFVTATINANNRYKVYMVEKVSELVRQLHPQRNKTISLQVLPLLWQLLSMMTTGGSNKGTPNLLRQSTTRLVKDLKEVLGTGLMEYAQMNSKVNLPMRHMLQELMQFQGEYDDDGGGGRSEEHSFGY